MTRFYIQSQPPIQVHEWGIIWSSPNIKSTANGRNHTLYLNTGGTVWAVGRNNNGQLGNGTNNDDSHPVQVLNSDGSILKGIIEIDAGDEHSLFEIRWYCVGCWLK